MQNPEVSTTNRIARLIHSVGNRQIWEVHYAWLNGAGLMVVEGSKILSIQRKYQDRSRMQCKEAFEM